jgi:hypothetical protein
VWSQGVPRLPLSWDCVKTLKPAGSERLALTVSRREKQKEAPDWGGQGPGLQTSTTPTERPHPP